MSEYTNPILDTIPADAHDEIDAQASSRPGRGFTALPAKNPAHAKGRYPVLLVDWSTETMDPTINYPLAGQRRVRVTFETEHDGRTRKLFCDVTDFPARWAPKDGQVRGDYVREYTLAAGLLKATGHLGKPLSDALEAARTTFVDLEIGVDKKKPDRNVVYGIHSAAQG